MLGAVFYGLATAVGKSSAVTASLLLMSSSCMVERWYGVLEKRSIKGVRVEVAKGLGRSKACLRSDVCILWEVLVELSRVYIRSCWGGACRV